MVFITTDIQLLAHVHADFVTLFVYVIITPVEALVSTGNQCNEALCKDSLVGACNQVITAAVSSLFTNGYPDICCPRA
jgi:hypothetical protein